MGYLCMWSSIHVCVVWYECMYVCVYGMCVYVVWCVYMRSVCGMCVMCYICVCDVCTCAFICACVLKDLHKPSRCAAQPCASLTLPGAEIKGP